MTKIHVYHKNYTDLKEDMVRIQIGEVLLEGGKIGNKFEINVSCIIDGEKKAIQTSESNTLEQFTNTVDYIADFYVKYPYIHEEQICFIFLRTIDGLVIGHKYIGKDKYPTDFHIDELYPGYQTSRGPGGGIEGVLDWINKEYYIFKDGERKWLENELKKSIKEKRDIIIEWKNGINVRDFSRNEAIKSLNGEKFGLEKWEEIKKSRNSFSDFCLKKRKAF